MTKQASRLAFDSLVPNKPLIANTQLRGKLVSISPFSSSTNLGGFSLASDNLTVYFELRGAWAEDALEVFGGSVGRLMAVQSRGGERVEVMRQQRDRQGDPVPGARKLKVVLDEVVEGAWVDQVTGKKGETFRFCAAKAFKKHRPASTKATLHLASDSPEPADALPPSRQPLSRTPSALSELSNQSPRSQQPDSLSRAKLKQLGAYSNAAPTEYPVPALDPANVLRKSISPLQRERKLKRSASSVASGEVREPPQKRQKVQRTEWGLKTTDREYVALDTLPGRKNSPGICVIGMAVVAADPAQACGGTGDWTILFDLYDPTMTAEPIRVRFFGQTKSHLPSVQDGDIVIIQQLNWNKDKNVCVAYKDKGNYRVLPADKLLADPPPTNDCFPPSTVRFISSISSEELRYARDLARWARTYDLLGNVLPNYAANGGMSGTGEAKDAKVISKALVKGKTGRQMKNIEAINPDEFCDTRGEIVKFYNPHILNRGQPVHRNEACILYITDYTVNEQLMHYEPDSSVRVAGQRVLQVSIFGAQNDPLLAFHEDKLKGRLVSLRNIRPKLNGSDLLEATMVEDEKYPEKRDVTLLDGTVDRAWYKELKARREAYWNSLAGPSDTLEPVFTASSSAAALAPIANTSGLSVQPIAPAVQLNSEGTYCFNVRVVGYMPRKIEEWVLATCPICERELQPTELACIDHGEVRCEWDFVLVLADETDPSSKILVHVDSADGARLFPTLANADHLKHLRSGDPVLLTQLTGLFRGTLGSLPTVYARSDVDGVKAGDVGPAWNVVVDAVRCEGAKQVRWQFKADRMSFK
ncbi:telomere-binding alpha subunit central domain protein [Rhodotorula toruloides]|uniref:Protection of telomeres protein 1 n=1 Tax=Rhodotorula toruloides TaxID=5286 RepID=A0A511KPB0_RHOTO|nr:telomere-binding alpha subunit central domain protein [Rhodotorula toruloides]